MNKFCIIANNEKDKDYVFSNTIKEYLERHNRTCIIAKETKEHVHEYDPYTDLSVIEPDTDCIIVLGGDGTLIHAANDLVNMDIPILGVNLGTLGFLTEVEKNNVFSALDRLFQKEYSLEKRMMLAGNIQNIYSGYALNDIVISKRGQCRIIMVKLWINDRLVDTYVCDGIVVSTATGSTGYNLSAGGPIVVPEMEGMMITAICPHSLNNRCIMVLPTDKIVLELGRSKDHVPDEANAIFDGRLISSLVSGDRIEIKRAKEVTTLVKATDTSFFELVQTKILKGGYTS